MPDMQQLAGATGNIPPQALAALQQQQAGGMDITAILAQLAQMSPDEVSQALAQLGINVPPDKLHEAAANWVENAGDRQASGADSGDSGETTSEEPTSDEATSAAQTPTDDEAVEATPDDEAAEGEGSEGSEGEADVAEAGQGASSTSMPPRTNSSGRGGAPNPALLARRGGGGMNMDALISAALSQGDPQSMPPPTRPPNVGAASAQLRAPLPSPSPAAGEDPRARAMIASIYRDAAARRGAPSTRAAPPPPMQAGRRRNV